MPVLFLLSGPKMATRSPDKREIRHGKRTKETTDRIKKVSWVQKRDGPPITMPSIVGIVGRGPAVDEKV